MSWTCAFQVIMPVVNMPYVGMPTGLWNMSRIFLYSTIHLSVRSEKLLVDYMPGYLTNVNMSGAAFFSLVPNVR